MSVDPRAALSCFINAVERHFELASSGRGNDDPHVQEAADSLADAFETYEDALYEAYGLNTPSSCPPTRTTSTTTSMKTKTKTKMMRKRTTMTRST